MGLFDRFTRQNADQIEDPGQQASTSAPADAAPHADAVHHGGEVLHETALNDALTALQAKPSGTAERFYNPYEGLSAAVDSRMSRGEAPVGFRLPSDLEYVFAEEASVQKRSWSENLCYYTGTAYLAGALTGGSRGVVTALKTKPEIGPDTARLRVNRLLNMTGKSGRQAGNSLGVLGLFFAGFESALDHVADGQIPDTLVTVLAGACTGTVFRSTRGPKTAAVAGAVGAVAASALVVARSTISRGL